MDYSDQLPPPARPEARAALPKSNADFRAFLDTPRPSRGGDETRNQNGSGEPSGAQKKKTKKPFKPKQEEEKVEEDDGPKYRSPPPTLIPPARPPFTLVHPPIYPTELIVQYTTHVIVTRQYRHAHLHRDRAAERRKQEDGDYSAVGEYSAVPAQPDMNNISIEESKFLGGDLEHTHLVKGLDFALLQKVLPLLWARVVNIGRRPEELVVLSNVLQQRKFHYELYPVQEPYTYTIFERGQRNGLEIVQINFSPTFEL